MRGFRKELETMAFAIGSQAQPYDSAIDDKTPGLDSAIALDVEKQHDFDDQSG